MLRAVIFDDEYIVIQGLRSMIDWSRYGIELVGTASDGWSAHRLFQDLRPDIVMTDIRMPGMDGLQLIEKILAEAPETACVVFSGFNEFEYIRTALKLGVIDYLEKPVTIEKIDEAMRRTTERIGRLREHAELRNRLEAGREALLEKATLDLLLQGEAALPGWRSAFGEQDADRVAAVTVLAASERHELPEEGGSCRPVALSHGNAWITAIFHYDPPSDAFWEHLALSAADMQGTIGSGRTYASAADAGKSFKEAQRALRYGLFLEEKGWTRFEHAEDGEAFPEGLSEREEELVFCLRTCNKAEMRRQLDAFRRWMEAERLNPELAEREMLRLAYLGIQVAKESGGDAKMGGRLFSVPHRELEGMLSRDEMFAWLQGQMEKLIDAMTQARQTSRHSAVDKAAAYIEKHYDRDLTLQEVAEHVGMNATYFSLLFKEKVGHSYIKYVTKLRLERAKSLLLKGMRVNEASEKVGYYNYRHFTELFKKHYGITPGQFRESREAGAEPADNAKRRTEDGRERDE